MERNQLGPILIGLVVVGLIFFMGACTNSVLNDQPAPPTTPTKVAYAVGWTPTPTPTPGPGLDQPIGWVWGQLPPELRDALRQRLAVTPVPTAPPSDLIDFEVGRNGCRYTVVKNATEKNTGSLAGDCVKIINALNPTPIPTATPSPTPEPQKILFYQNDLNDPRDGLYVNLRTYINYGSQSMALFRETESGSQMWMEAYGMLTSTPEANAYTYITRTDGQWGVGVDYFDGIKVYHDNFLLDDLFPIEAPAQLEPAPTAPPTPTGDGPFIWVANAGGLGLFLTARVDETRMASVFSLREYTPSGTLLVDDWFVTSTVYEFRGAEMRDDGFVYIRYGTSAQGADIKIRHRPWFR